ncbi:DNA polymerase III subunit delta' [Psychromonas hadalis]|uniref:DNA polymerase III subunit delta' n=1 Tax=Psychromonas hadalis TaxID=211669 RepID=UPI0003B76CA0|nr:DNA polymerase III subunit delta' [Psychromonas hadalis]
MPQSNVPTPWLDPIFETLKQNYQNSRFAHALLFTGSTGLGKFKLALRSAKYLLCDNKQSNGSCGNCHACNLFDAQNHLDFHLLQSENNKAIGIEQVRSLINTLNERPHLGDNKVVVIKDVQLLSTAAANALLKTLEEPQGNSYLILLSRTHHQLMPTLYSRVQHTHLHSPNDKQLTSWLEQQGVAVTDKGVLRQFQNCPLILLNHLKALQKGEATDERRNCVEGLFTLLNQAESLFDFSQFLGKEVESRLQLLFFMLHDLHKLKLTGQGLNDDAVYFFALPQLQIWSEQITLKSLRYLNSELLKTRALLVEHSGLKKELLISALLIKIKKEFKEQAVC